MDDAAAVRMVERVREIEENPTRHVGKKATLVPESPAERFAGHKRHDDVGEVRCFAEIEHRHDRRVGERGGETRFASKAVARVSGQRDTRDEHLDRDQPLQRTLACAKDHAHAALAMEIQNLVARAERMFERGAHVLGPVTVHSPSAARTAGRRPIPPISERWRNVSNELRVTKPRPRYGFATALAVTLCTGALEAQTTSAELTADQRRLIDAGEQVFVTRDSAKTPWPMAWVYQFIDARPEEAAAVFADAERQVHYVPDLKRSRVLRTIAPGVFEVAQEMRVPIVRDEWWEVRDTVSAGDDGSYRIAWTLVRARTTKSVTGYAHFEPYHNARTGRDGTLLTYHNFVVPGSRIAGIGLIERHALKKLRETARALRDEVERERAHEPELLARQVAALHEMLKGAKSAELLPP